VKKLEVGNIITLVLPDGTLSAQIGCPDEEMRSGKLIENGQWEWKRMNGILVISRLSVIHEENAIFIYPHYFT